MQGLNGKRFVVAGGATGIGAATAKRLAAEGGQVVVGDINVAGVESTVAKIVDAGGKAVAVAFDLGDPVSIAALIERSVSEFGGIDGLFNVGADLRGASALPLKDSDVLDIDMELWEHDLRLNLLGYAHASRAALPHMLAQGHGVIINTSSGAATGTLPNRPAYATTKAGVEAMTKHTASRFGKEGIRCNAVAPGLVIGELQIKNMDTALQNQALAAVKSTRLGRPDDLAATVAFLMSDDAEWINGQVWTIDGGMSMH